MSDDIERVLDRLDRLLRQPAADLPPPARSTPPEPRKGAAPGLSSTHHPVHSGSEPALSADRVVIEAVAALRVPELRDVALNTLTRAGDAAIPAVLLLLHDPDRQIRQIAAIATARIRDRRILPQLVRVAHWTFNYASAPRDPHAVPALLEALVVGSPPTRVGVAIALGRLAQQNVPVARAVPELIELLNDPYPLVRMAAVWALGCVADPATAPHLSISLYDLDPLVRRLAADALTGIGTPEALHAVGASQRPDQSPLED